MLYNARRDLAIKLNLRRIIAGGRLFDYCKYANIMSAEEYANKVVNGELEDSVLSFHLERDHADIDIRLPRSSGRDAAKLRDAMEQNTSLHDELNDFKVELLRVAALPYRPSLNDGVLISAAPLWKLFSMPKWRKALQECWEGLESLKYPWARLSLAVLAGQGKRGLPERPFRCNRT